MSHNIREQAQCLDQAVILSRGSMTIAQCVSAFSTSIRWSGPHRCPHFHSVSKNTTLWLDAFHFGRARIRQCFQQSSAHSPPHPQSRQTSRPMTERSETYIQKLFKVCPGGLARCKHWRNVRRKEKYLQSRIDLNTATLLNINVGQTEKRVLGRYTPLSEVGRS